MFGHASTLKIVNLITLICCGTFVTLQPWANWNIKKCVVDLFINIMKNGNTTSSCLCFHVLMKKYRIKFKLLSNSGQVWTIGWCPQTIAKEQHLPRGKTSKGEEWSKLQRIFERIDLTTITWCSDCGQVWVGQECYLKGASHPNPESGGGKADNTAIAQTQFTTEIRFAGIMRYRM